MSLPTARPYVVTTEHNEVVDRCESERKAEQLVTDLHFHFNVSAFVLPLTSDHPAICRDRPLTKVYVEDSGFYIARSYYVARTLKTTPRKKLIRDLLECFPESFTRQQARSYPSYVIATILNQI